MNDTQGKQNINSRGFGASERIQLTGKQLVAVVFILAIATKMFLFTIFLIQVTGRDAYLAVAAGGAFDLAMLGIMLFAVYKSGERDFFELLTAVFGRVGAKIIVAIIALFMLFKLNIGVAESMMFYADSLFTDFTIPLMIIVLLIFFMSVGVHTLRAFGRLCELLIPLIVVGLAVLITIVIMTGYDFSNLLPVLRYRDTFNVELVHHASWMGDFTPLVLFMGRTRVKKLTVVCASIGGILGTFVIVFFAAVLCAAFGNVPLLVDTSTNISSILQFSVGNIYGRTDMFSSVLWSVSAFLGNALFFYSTCRCVSFVIGKDANFIIGLCVCAVTYVLQVFALTDQTMFSVVTTSAVGSVTIPTVSVLVSILAAVCSVVGNEKFKRKQQLGEVKK